MPVEEDTFHTNEDWYLKRPHAPFPPPICRRKGEAQGLFSMVAAARAALLAAALASALALPPRRPGADQDGVAERLERLESGLLPVPAPPASRDAPAQTLPARAARVQELVRSGHGQVGRWFRDLVPLVECAGEPACTAGALAQVTRKSDLWTLPGMEGLVELVRGNATWFAGRVACAAPTVAAFQEALEALPGPAPRIALVPGGRAPLRAAGRPWITISPRAAEALGRVGELLTAPMAALEAKGNLTLALEVDVDDAWFLAGRPSEDVSAVHLVGEGRIIVNPRHAAKLRAIAAAGAGVCPRPPPLVRTPSDRADWTQHWRQERRQPFPACFPLTRIAHPRTRLCAHRAAQQATRC